MRGFFIYVLKWARSPNEYPSFSQIKSKGVRSSSAAHKEGYSVARREARTRTSLLLSSFTIMLMQQDLS